MNIWQVATIFFNVITPVFIIPLIGYLTGPRLGLQTQTLSKSAYYVFIPAFVFNILSRPDLELSRLADLVLFIIVSHIVFAFLGYLVAKILRRSAELVAAFVMITVFGNVGNFGLSLTRFQFGQIVEVPAAVYFVVSMITAMTISILFASKVRGSGMQAIKSVLKTPALLVLVPAIGFSAFRITVPVPIERATGLLGDVMIPLMLFAIGVHLAETKDLGFSLDVLLGGMLRLIGCPLIVLLLVIPFHLPDYQNRMVAVLSGMPVAVVISIIGIEFNVAPKLLTTTVLFTTLTSIITLTLILALV
jgi:hypothetical protein